MNFEEVVVKEDLGLCRCCHSEGNFKDLNQEYVWMEETEVYAEMLQQCFNIRILCYPGCNGINGAQQLICEDCIARLRKACTFRKQVTDAERKMSNMLGLQQTEGASEVSIKIEPTPEALVTDDTPEEKLKPESNEDIDIEEHGVTPRDNSDHYNDASEEPVASSSCKRSKSEATARKRAKNETKHAKNSETTDDGTKKAEEVEGWCKLIEVESDEDDEDDKPTPVDVTCQESAVLPPNLTEDVRQWLQNEDAEADRIIQTMLPIDQLTFDWTCDHNSFTGQREVFTASPGPTFTLDDTTTPLDIFRRMFDDDLLDLIVTQTNNYSNLIIDKITTEHSRLSKWTNIDKGEIVIFLAILILQGLAPLSVESDYWQENGYLTLKYFKNLMTYNRYTLIKRLLHFSDNMTDLTGLTKAQRKLWKIQPVLDHLNGKFSRLYLPKQCITIDESLLKGNGRLSFAQKIIKAAKAGIQCYELCETDTGYLWSFVVYTGDKTTDATDEQTHKYADITDDLQAITNSVSSSPPVSNATAHIVQILAEPLLGLGYTLILDSFCNSPLLVRYLKSQKTDCFGTLRVNRKFVPEVIESLANKEMRVGETVQTFSEDVSVTLWRDANVVAMVSTLHGGEVGGKKHNRYKPQIVLDYNLAIGGIDRKNQLLSAHPIERSKNMAWYKKVFRRLLNVTIHNAFVIFKSRNTSITNRAFRQRLADEMIKAYLPPRLQTPLVRSEDIQCPGGKSRVILEGNHFIGPGLSKQARCVWCRRSRSKYICKQCNVSLCLDICFEEYHTKH